MFPASFLFPSSQARRPSAQSPRHRRRVFFEPLEDRRVLAATLSLDGVGGGGGTAMILDNAFDLDGRVRTDLSLNKEDIAWDTALQSDGTIVAVGQARPGTNDDMAVVRYNSNGSIVSSFVSGLAGNDAARAVAIQPDDKILIAGYREAGSNGFDFAVMRLHANGTLDTDFGVGGVSTVHFGDFDFGEDLALQADGKIVVVGTLGGGANVAIARLSADGKNLDGSFAGGKVTLNLSGGEEFAAGVAIQGNGQIVVASQVTDESGVGLAALTRLNAADGSIDASFGGGTVLKSFAAVGSQLGGFVESVAMDGAKIIATGMFIHDANNEDVFVLRYNADGTPDNSFDGDGLVTRNLGAAGRDRAIDVAVGAGGKIVVAGSTDIGATGDDFLLLRYNTDGSPDTTFAPGNQSFIRTDFNATSHEIVRGVVVTPTAIVAAGSINTSAKDFALARYVVEPGGPVTLPAINEGQLTTLSGTYSKDTVGNATLLIQWGDLTSTEVTVSGTSGSFSVDHRYLDNPASGTSFTITATLLDASPATATIAVSNVAPVFLTVNSATINEGGTSTISGSFADAGIVPTGGADGNVTKIDSHTIVVTWAPGVTSAATIDPLTRTFTASRLYADDTPTGTLSDNFAVTVELKDDELAAAPTASATVTVNNVPPVASLVAPEFGLRGQPVALVGSFTDVGILDTHQVKWTFGDGTEIPYQPSTNTGALAPTRVYAANGEYTVTLTVKDDDGGEHSVSKLVKIVAVMIQAAPGGTGTAVAIAGTEGADLIIVSSASNGVEVSINSVSLGVWNPTHAVVIHAYGGDDEARIDGSVALGAWVYAGAGNDKVKGGAGHDVLLGQLGDDLLVGGSGRDILIGGLGSDRIVGNSDDDILISGTTSHDANAAALAAILAEWTSSRDAATRIANLSGTGSGPKANGTFYLIDSTVHDDGARDVMTGSSGFDWFFANVGSESDQTKDKITDLSAAEFAGDLGFIES